MILHKFSNKLAESQLSSLLETHMNRAYYNHAVIHLDTMYTDRETDLDNASYGSYT